MEQTYEQIKAKMETRGGVKHWTKKDVELIKAARISGDWSEVHSRNFYKKYSGEYCYLLQVIEWVEE